ncbi:MAG: tetratricopeptide repeat protein [Candidatus Aegiribacteria sp.]|nr:tetratricopeptide repeat protein [Candidatus Aegiribacteria sp.]
MPASSEQFKLKPGERRDIAVLYLDLDGFTALSEKLDHEAVHEIAKSIMDALVDVSEEYEGYVDKIEGDRIMVLFGARKAGENDSIRAISCGFRMLDAIRTASSILTETGIPITASIGINSGPVTVAPDAIGHLTAIGKTVNLASRMEEAAGVNSILVPDNVQEKCGDMICWEDMGSISIKGIRYPVHVWCPTGPGNQLKARWDRIKKISTSSFVGRSDEMSILDNKLAIQESGGTGTNRLGGVKHLVLGIKSEAGMGKSRLVHEFIRRQCDDRNDILVLKSQALSYAQPAYWLWTSLLRDLLELEHGNKLDYSDFKERLIPFSDEDLMNSAPFLAELLSIKSGDRRLVELDSSAIALETGLAFRNLLKALSKKNRLLIVLDDLHWIDNTCRRVFEFIVANCNSKNSILFLLLYRPERTHGETVEFDISNSYAEFEEIFLPELCESDCHKLIGKFLSGISDIDNGSVSSEVERFLFKHAEGNSYFLEELILNLVESDILHENCEEWNFSNTLSDIYIPSSLAGLLQSRLDRLPEELKSTLQKSSVLGVEFKLQLYNRLIEELSLEERCQSVFNNLERRRFIIDTGTALEQKYMFRNILIHETAYNSILESNRKLLHRIAAQLIEEMYSEEEYETAAMLTYHWERAEVRKKAILWGIKNLNHTVVNYQHDTALRLSEKLELWLCEDPEGLERNEQLLEVLFRRNGTLELLGKRKEQEQLLVRMQNIAEDNELKEWTGKILSALGNVFRITGRLEEALDCYRRAIDLHREIGDRKNEGIALGNMGILTRIQGNLQESGEYFQEALEINREIGDRRIEGVVLGNLGNLYLDQNRIDEAIEYYEKALKIYREVGDRRSEGIALGNLGNPFRDQERIEEALEHYQRALKLHREIGNRRSEGITLGNLGILHFQQGQLEEAFEYYRKALEIHREIGNRRLEAITLDSLGMLYMKKDRREETLECYRKALLVIEELKLSATEFDNYTELHRYLLSSDLSEEGVKWPSHWEMPENQ